MPYLGYFNSTYVPSDAERLFIAQSATHLGPNLMSLAFTHLLQGVVIVQGINYASRWWNTDTVYTKAHVLAVLLLSLVHTALLTASQWDNFIIGFGNWESLTHISVLARSSTLSATIFFLASQAFFIARIYHLQWRFDYLFIPLIFLFACALGTGIGVIVAAPAQLVGTAYPETFRRLEIISAVFPLLLCTASTACLLAFLCHKALPSSKPALYTVTSFVLHSALPSTFLALFNLTTAFEQPPFAFGALTHSMLGYVQAACMLYVLSRRTHPSSPETEASGRDLATSDLRWTARVPLLGTAPRLALLPVHRRAGSDPSHPLAADAAHARRVSDADSGRSISFMPPGLYDPRAFKAIYDLPEHEHDPAA